MCRECRLARNRLPGGEIPESFAETFLHPEDRIQAQAYIAGLKPESWQDSTIDEVPLASYASYEFLLARKINDPLVPAELWSEFTTYVHNTFLTFRIAQRALRALKPDRVILYNTLYGPNRVWQHLAEGSGIPTYSIHGGHDMSKYHDTLMVYRDDNRQVLLAQSSETAEALQRPISGDDVRSVGLALRAQLEARTVWVYSKAHEKLHPRDVRERLGIRPRSTVVLAPLASADERYASSVLRLEAFNQAPTTFADQAAWIEGLFALCIERPELDVIVRLHPRMFPNRRENQLARSAEVILSLLEKRPRNLIANTPDHHLSLTDILQVTDVGLNGTSTVGLQMLSFGIPVVIHDSHLLFSFPAQIGLSVTDSDLYGAALDEALSIGWSLETSMLAFRWLNFLHRGVARDVIWRVPSESRKSPKTKPAVTEFAFRQRLKQRVPFAAKSIRRSLRSANQLDAAIDISKRDQPPLGDIEHVLRYELSGLQSLYLANATPDANVERRAVVAELNSLAATLGVFPDEAGTLGARLARLC